MRRVAGGPETPRIGRARGADGGRKSRRCRFGEPRIGRASVLEHTALVRHDDRHAGRHRLEWPDAEWFARVGVHEHIRAGVERGQRQPIEIPAQQDAYVRAAARANCAMSRGSASRSDSSDW